MNSLDIVNSILVDGGYTARIPQATRENIASVGNTILKDAVTANAFFTELVNRIGKVIIESYNSMDDIYAVFGEDELPFGDTIQKIYIDIPKSKAFDGTVTTSMLTQEKGTIHVEYTKVDRKFFYKTTISVPQLKEAFISVAKLDDFVQKLLESMAKALSLDKYIMTTDVLYKHCIYVYQVKDVNDTDDHEVSVLQIPSTVAKYNKTTKEIEWDTVGAKKFLKMLRIASRALTFPHALSYGDVDETNAELDNGGTISAVRTPLAKQVLALEVSSMAEIDVEALAQLFNLNKADIKQQTIEIEDGALGFVKNKSGSTVDVYAMGFLCDKTAVERGKSYEDTDSFKNPEGQYVNFWNHFWGYMAVSKFKDFMPIVIEAYTPSNN